MTLRVIVREEGVLALWRGAGPRVVRRTLHQALTWTMFAELVKLFGGEDASRRMTVASSS